MRSSPPTQAHNTMCSPDLFLLLSILVFISSSTHFRTLAYPYRYDPHRYHRTPRASPPQRYLGPTGADFLLPRRPPSCSLTLLRHDFANTYGRPPASAPYATPPGCPPPWDRVVLDLSVACAGEQYDRIAAVWLDGAEILRTSTAEPSEAGVFWRVRKDVTRYDALLRRQEGGVVSMMLENIVNDEFTGVYHVNVSLDFYIEDGEEPRFRPRSMLPTSDEESTTQEQTIFGASKPLLPPKIGFSSFKSGSIENNAKVAPFPPKPSDLIIPISSADSQNGFWFRIKNEADVHFKSVQIPGNTYWAVLEIYVSYHSNDEFWYSNPPNSYIVKNNLTTGRGNGSFREVFATIDGSFVSSIVPFPVIFTGGINPLFWEPVVALGAFDLPSYNIELTPLLGLLLDGKSHDIGVGVTDGISFWLIDANLHIWLDPLSTYVTAQLVQYQAPRTSISRKSKLNLLNGKFKIKAQRESRFLGWVSSSFGNLTTDVDQKLKFKSLVNFTDDGAKKGVYMQAKLKTTVRIGEGPNTLLTQVTYKSKYPLMFVSSTLSGVNNTYTMKTYLSHILSEKTTVLIDKVETFSSIRDHQDADGWMLVQDHSVLAGSAGTQQTYHYEDDHSSYLRKVIARDGLVLSDTTTASSSSSSS
ncbi:hypothetical protein ZIOFF_051362 [Zingiber officinale]|uniref:Peptide N-acetyl-beta-D-glucosaminyl asparaginase amidase A N-terminal domain-containing protein n=2 Tax=Zingiber officinale TaxID=94328 RepID=A0A8J5KH95_ZINOF|nr:hypothetical protein ZIOFF_051362 [Zingiber officinale]